MSDLQIGIYQHIPFFDLNPELHEHVTLAIRWLYTWKMLKEFGLKLKIANFLVPTAEYMNERNDLHYT